MKRPSARAPAFRERLSDFEATNGGSFSSHGERGSPDKAHRAAIRDDINGGCRRYAAASGTG
ncbi:hypothetical protein DNK66_15725 [Klebsiella aerogenes]|nr:hypothetical protein DNK66_15725 [Klebsiella aerogenes]